MPKYIAAIDQGTTSTRFIIFDHGGNIIAVDQKEHKQIYPKPGWVEHDPLEIWIERCGRYRALQRRILLCKLLLQAFSQKLAESV